MAYTGAFHREFVVTCPRPASEIVSELCKQGILAGVDLGRFYPEIDNQLLIAFTERRSYQQIDALVDALGKFAGQESQKADVAEPQSFAH